jgi:hypothetical protein
MFIIFLRGIILLHGPRLLSDRGSVGRAIARIALLNRALSKRRVEERTACRSLDALIREPPLFSTLSPDEGVREKAG